MPDTAHTQTEQQQLVRSIAEKARFAMLTSTAANGSLESRPMTVLRIEDDFSVLFVTQRDTDVAQQAADHQVNLAFRDGHDFVSIAGRGELVDDLQLKRDLFNEATQAFTGSGADDPANVILAVRADSAQYWNSPAAPVVLFDMVKARLTGNRPEGGEAGTVTL